MLSGVGPADQLSTLGIPAVHNMSGVGQNLRDHPSVSVAWRTKEGFSMDADAPRFQVALRYTASGSEFRNDMQNQPRLVRHPTNRPWRGWKEPIGIAMNAVLNLALGQGEMRLTSIDPSVQPSLNYNYLQEPFDRQRLREAVRLCVELAEHDSFRSIIADRIARSDAELDSDGALDDWLMREASTGQHISGTCKMGPSSDPMSVVDQFGRVHGLDHLRVADASIMPNCIRANTNVTTMMIGERLASLMLGGD